MGHPVPLAASALLAALLPLAATAGDRPGFVADGTLSVCLDPTFPPMEFMAEGGTDPMGVDVDVARALAGHWAVEVAFQPMEFTGILPSLAAGRCDVAISGMLLTEERLQSFDGVGYLNTFIVVAGPSGAPPLESGDDLAGRTIAVQSGTTYLARMEALNADLAARGLAPMTIQQYPKQTDAILQLALGRVEGVVTQDTEIAWRERENPGQFSVIWTVPQETVEPYAIYFRKSEEDRAAVTAAVDALVADGTMAAILAEWGLPATMLENLR
ncbi:ABC transporter substrate-binding protein [Rubellimicrobium sp. CFH 75288]|uniref:ABC transporter substrate-binding protein n=1 Tax=Rubellimicrobium sp. CFH 75288 TaxID=2697034 RepID=UPI00141287C4|nr:ABC transporter substrate-binding protein [Rubellimicrobium sp. CFH 75288]NAZ35722.1 transporter substrate-binding domain-containing protein [Rubellimicrobium sp. CFH 75288]